MRFCFFILLIVSVIFSAFSQSAYDIFGLPKEENVIEVPNNETEQLIILDEDEDLPPTYGNDVYSILGIEEKVENVVVPGITDEKPIVEEKAEVELTEEKAEAELTEAEPTETELAEEPTEAEPTVEEKAEAELTETEPTEAELAEEPTETEFTEAEPAEEIAETEPAEEKAEAELTEEIAETEPAEEPTESEPNVEESLAVEEELTIAEQSEEPEPTELETISIERKEENSTTIPTIEPKLTDALPKEEIIPSSTSKVKSEPSASNVEPDFQPEELNSVPDIEKIDNSVQAVLTEPVTPESLASENTSEDTSEGISENTSEDTSENISENSPEIITIRENTENSVRPIGNTFEPDIASTLPIEEIEQANIEPKEENTLTQNIIEEPKIIENQEENTEETETEKQGVLEALADAPFRNTNQEDTSTKDSALLTPDEVELKNIEHTKPKASIADIEELPLTIENEGLKNESVRTIEDNILAEPEVLTSSVQVMPDVEELVSEITRLNNEKKTLNEEIEKLRKRNAELEKEISELKIKDEQNEFAKNEEIKNLKNTYEQSTIDKNSELENIKNQLEQSNIAKEHEILELKTKISKLENDLLLKDEKIKELDKLYNETKATLENVEEALRIAKENGNIVPSTNQASANSSMFSDWKIDTSSFTKKKMEGFLSSNPRIGSWKIVGNVASQTNSHEYFSRLEMALTQNNEATVYRFKARSAGENWVGLGLHLFTENVKSKRSYGEGKSLLVWLTRDPAVRGDNATYLQLYRSDNDVVMERMFDAELLDGIDKWHDIEILYDPGAEYIAVSIDGQLRIVYKTFFKYTKGGSVSLRTLGGSCSFKDFSVWTK